MKNPINKAIKNLYRYDNYRSFLKDFFDEQKKIKKSFTHRYLAELVGFSSPSYFHHIVKGERNLTKTSLEKIAKVLDLSNKDKKFFTNLVLCNQAKTAEEKQFFHKNLNSMRQSSKFFQVNSKQFDYFKKWYYPIIRELVVLSDWQDSYKKLASFVRPAITEKQAETAVATLIDVGMIKHSKGKYTQSNELQSYEKIPTYIKKDLRKNVLLKGMDAAELMSAEERHISFTTVGVSENTYNEITELFDTIRKKITADSLNEEKVDKICNVVFEIYPVSTNIGGSDA